MILAAVFIAIAAPADVHLVDRPVASKPNAYYVGNRAPLLPSPFVKLPIGAIKPEGWIRKQLELEANGFTGHLGELSEFLIKKNNAWLSPTGQGVHGWEELPYWLKGFGDLGYVLGDKRVTREARTWIDAVLSSQREDGWLGPRSNLVANNGKPDMWPNMPMLFALQSYYERFGDPRVITAMTRYFRWQLELPENDFYLSYWEKQRGGDNLYSVYWLYNRTGQPWLLDLAKKIHRRTADWADGVPDWHGVNFAQAFREPAEFSELSHSAQNLEATEADYHKMRGLYGQVPGGMYGADENARPGHKDPRQAAETCAMVEMMLSNEMLFTMTGDPTWAERCEDVAFNSLPASMTPDERALHYLTAPNMVVADRASKAPELQNGGNMLSFDPYDYRCCQHNSSQGWPYYAEHLWLATGDNGLAAALYAPSVVRARAGSGETVTIRESTEYPFRDTVDLSFSMARPNRFPLTLRLPSWCDSPRLTLNGKPLMLSAGKQFAVVDRTWRKGDRLSLRLPMRIRLKKWADNDDSVSVERGPLTYSLEIGQKYVRKGGTDKWPAFEVLPTSAWNYGLVPDVAAMRVVERPIRPSAQPFDLATAPVEILARARRIPEWRLDTLGMVGALRPSPAFSKAPIETVRLVPMGAARLRISSFPTVSESPSAHHWVAPPVAKKALPAISSHTFSGDTVNALSDGLLPSNSGDQEIPRFTWWDHKGGTEWVEYDLRSPRTVSSSSVYWFDDRRSGGECRLPASWRLLYWDAGAWHDVKPSGPYEVAADRFCGVRFEPVRSARFRLEARLQSVFSGGILEWRL